MLITDLPHIDRNIFDCISMQNQIHVPVSKVKVLDYMITDYPRNENRNDFPFVFGFFEPKEISFSKNQDVVINVSNLMFQNSIFLTDFEQRVLNETFHRGLKTQPTLSGRK